MAEYIERDSLGIGYADPKVFDNPAYAEGWNSAIKIINEAPASDVAPVKHGQWAYNPNGHDWNLGAWECSLCYSVNNNLPGDKRFSPYAYVGSNFCPNCGAKMDGDKL